jgi:hypothetical protein
VTCETCNGTRRVLLLETFVACVDCDSWRHEPLRIKTVELSDGSLYVPPIDEATRKRVERLHEEVKNFLSLPDDWVEPCGYFHNPPYVDTKQRHNKVLSDLRRAQEQKTAVAAWCWCPSDRGAP